MNYTGFPVNYAPMNYNPQMPQPPVYNAPSTNNGIIWVQGEAGAKAYPVAAGASLLLMDSEAKQFYIKSTDPSGIPSPLRVFSYEEVVESATVPKETKEFITRDEFERRFAELTAKPTRSKKEVKEDE